MVMVSLIHFYKRCVIVPMILSFLCSSNNASLTPFTCNVLGLLSRWWCMVICQIKLDSLLQEVCNSVNDTFFSMQ